MQIIINYKLDNWNDMIKHCRNNNMVRILKNVKWQYKIILCNVPPNYKISNKN